MIGDIMYLQQALSKPDAKEFVDTVVKEINGHVDCNNWTLKKQSKVPEDIQIVPSVWSLQCKCNTRLNLHGCKQVYGMNYFETYVPLVTWFHIRLMITFGIIFCWALCQVNVVKACPQAPVEMNIYMELPQGIQTVHGNSKDNLLNLEKNICGQEQAGHVWNLFLVGKLTSLAFTPSLIDDCVFYPGDIIFMVYLDDPIFFGADNAQLQQAIKETQDLGLNIEDQGIKKFYGGSCKFTQRALIDSIIEDAGLNDSTTKPVLTKVSLRLHAFKDEPAFDLDFKYRSVVGMLNYWLKLLILTSCMPCTRLPSTHQTKENLMAKKFSI
jgi:hypothetical protein